jgi:hypothetical protein
LNAGGGDVSITGFGAQNAAGGAIPHGVSIGGNAVITTAGTGSITLTGTGAANGTATLKAGLLLTGAPGNDSSIFTSGTGSVNLVGLGGNSGTAPGIEVFGGTKRIYSSSGGAVTLTGTGGFAGEPGIAFGRSGAGNSPTTYLGWNGIAAR